MRVLVTGATGFVGGRVAARLRDRGDEVRALVRTPSEELTAIGVEQHEVGLDDPDAITAVLDGCSGVVHAAAAVGPDLASARRVNRDGTAALVTAAARAGAHRFVHLSTCAVYDREAGGDLLTEDAPLVREGSPYAVTKAEAEVEAAAGRSQGLSVAVLRPPAVLGAGPTSTWGTRVPRRARDGELPAQHPSTTFGWVHVEDLVDAAVAALDSTAEVTVNVVGGHTTWEVYVEAVRALFAEAPPPPDADGDPWTGWYATDRLPETLGVRPHRSYEEAMEEIAASWQRPA